MYAHSSASLHGIQEMLLDTGFLLRSSEHVLLYIRVYTALQKSLYMRLKMKGVIILRHFHRRNYLRLSTTFPTLQIHTAAIYLSNFLVPDGIRLIIAVHLPPSFPDLLATGLGPPLGRPILGDDVELWCPVLMASKEHFRHSRVRLRLPLILRTLSTV